MGRFGKFWREESGSTAAEYSLILTVIALSIIAGITLWGQAVKETFDKAAAKML